jgi:hypothetical protein
MKAQSINWTSTSGIGSSVGQSTAQRLASLTMMVGKAFTATVGGLAVLVGMAVAISMPQFDNYVLAGLWAAGFIFLALAIEARKPLAFAVTGLALPAIALASYSWATEWAMTAAAILAAWLVYAVYRK